MDPQTASAYPPTPATPTLRIFISSPGDVAEEREKARQVIAQLQNWYGDAVHLVPGALGRAAAGTRLPPSSRASTSSWARTPSTSPSSSSGPGSARPWASPYSTARANPTAPARNGSSTSCSPPWKPAAGNGRTSSFTAGTTTPSFDRRAGRCGTTRQAASCSSRSKLAKSFVQEHFQDEEGHNTRAYHRFHQPVEFAVAAQGPPARPHRPAHRGREGPARGPLDGGALPRPGSLRSASTPTSSSAAKRRSASWRTACASGKREGLRLRGRGRGQRFRQILPGPRRAPGQPDPVQPGRIRPRAWRSAVLLPGQTEGQPLLGLVRALGAGERALPELAQAGLTRDRDRRSPRRIPGQRPSAPSSNPPWPAPPKRPGATVEAPAHHRPVRGTLHRQAHLRGGPGPLPPRPGSPGPKRLVLGGGHHAQRLLSGGPEDRRSSCGSKGETRPVRPPASRPGGPAAHHHRTGPDGGPALRETRSGAGRPEPGGQDPGGRQGPAGHAARCSPTSCWNSTSCAPRKTSSPSPPTNPGRRAAHRPGRRPEPSGRKRSSPSSPRSSRPPARRSSTPWSPWKRMPTCRRRANLAALRDTPQKAALVDAFIRPGCSPPRGRARGRPRCPWPTRRCCGNGTAIADWVRDNRQYLRIRSRVEQALQRWSDAGSSTRPAAARGPRSGGRLSLLRDAPQLLAGSEYDARARLRRSAARSTISAGRGVPGASGLRSPSSSPSLPSWLPQEPFSDGFRPNRPSANAIMPVTRKGWPFSRRRRRWKRWANITRQLCSMRRGPLASKA